jgi:proteasome lid subunit RPN8/RPN11
MLRNLFHGKNGNKPRHKIPGVITPQPPVTNTPAAKPTAPARKPDFEVNTGGISRGMTQIKNRNKSNNMPAEPTVYYTWQVKRKMDLIVSTCTQEVGWMGLVETTKEGDFVIIDVFVPEQEVHATETEISADALCKLALELMEKDIGSDKLFAWYHSHVNMGVSPSTQDETQVEEFLENCPIFIRGIVNKKGESKVDVYYRDHGVAYTCVPTRTLLPALDEDTQKALLDDIEKNVTQVSFIYGNYRGFQNYNNPWGDDDGDYLDGNRWKLTDNTNPRALPPPTHPNHTPANTSAQTSCYGIEWDETTPVRERPYKWWDDLEYQEEGFPRDVFVEYWADDLMDTKPGSLTFNETDFLDTYQLLLWKHAANQQDEDETDELIDLSQLQD